MREFTYIITDPDGIHARPAGELVKAAKEFESDIKLEKDGKTTDAKKIFGVMGLGIKHGQAVKIIIEGSDEDKAAECLEKFMQNKL